jgi:hypothetical protein
LPALLTWHAEITAQHQLAPVLDEALLQRIGIENFWVHERPDGYLAAAVLWDQSAFKQIVARRYRNGLRWALPAYNAYARIARRVPLPPQGQALSQTFISFLAFSPEAVASEPAAQALIGELLAKCLTPVAALGLHDGHPLEPVLRQFKPMSYPATIYAVEFDAPAALDERAVQPEAALL